MRAFARKGRWSLPAAAVDTGGVGTGGVGTGEGTAAADNNRSCPSMYHIRSSREMKRQPSRTYRSHQCSPVQHAVADNSVCRKTVEIVFHHHLLLDLFVFLLCVFHHVVLILLVNFQHLQFHLLIVLQLLMRKRVDFARAPLPVAVALALLRQFPILSLQGLNLLRQCPFFCLNSFVFAVDVASLSVVALSFVITLSYFFVFFLSRFSCSLAY